jgi:non-heme chloroperoxidase
VPTNPAPVVFVHGLWLHADSWGAWVDLFRDAGYEPVTPGWPGDSSSVEETRQYPERVAGKGINDIVDHYAKIIADLSAPPILIGHSFGGLIVERLLGEGLGARLR